MLAQPQPAHRVFHHHDRAIHDEAEVHGPQAQQARRDANLQHQFAREQHRERDGSRHDQPGPEVAEEGEKNRDDEECAGEQVVLHRADDIVHEFGAVIENLQPHILGQLFLHFVQAVF